MGETIESLRYERNLLAETLGKVLVAYGMIRPDAQMTLPVLLLAAEDAVATARKWM